MHLAHTNHLMHIRGVPMGLDILEDCFARSYSDLGFGDLKNWVQSYPLTKSG